ncbi:MULTISPECIES: WXG100 family type VII secretion target [unclassified Saccharopolyspora]|uniref:WXG100 family type VII secretion target n=1 Tax=Saccharopolyspora TaxID=1835 RepID=UPI00190B85F6|nr:WXG100 family type VII secretion target [Saccharopolyspora sp. HNM0986]MBK0865929.1 WXG100 family type VII secretion target [Saccharopolyspora sp. HNM0986]
MAPKVYDYEALQQAQQDMKKTVDHIRDEANKLISQAQQLQQNGWTGESAQGYNASAEKLKQSLNGFGEYLTQQQQNVNSGTGNMQDTDKQGGKQMGQFA